MSIMGRKAVSTDVKWQIIGQHKCHKSEREISKSLNVSKNCVHQTIKRYLETKDVREKVNSQRGRPRKTDSRTDRRLFSYVKKNRTATNEQIRLDLNLPIGNSSISNRLLEKNLRSRTAAHKPLLTKKNMLTRDEWSREHLDWTEEKWDTTIFSDESSFQLFSNRAVRVRRTTEEKFKPECTVPKVQKGGGSVMVWGCVSAKGCGELAFIEGTMNTDKYLDVMENYLLPSKKKLFGRRKTWLYQQDNAPCHVSRKALAWFEQKRIPLLKWPARSPDMNPIEEIWDLLARKLTKIKINSVKELKAALASAWQELSKNKGLLKDLIRSMPRRVQALRKAKGGITKY